MIKIRYKNIRFRFINLSDNNLFIASPNFKGGIMTLFVKNKQVTLKDVANPYVMEIIYKQMELKKERISQLN
jgi:hypothetical protein